MGVPPPWGQNHKLPFSSLLLKTKICSHEPKRLKFTPVRFYGKTKILQQKFFASQCAKIVHGKKIVRKMKNSKIFFHIQNCPNSDYMHAKFRQNRTIFWPHFCHGFCSHGVKRKNLIENFLFYKKTQLAQILCASVHANKFWFLVVNLKMGAC